MKIALGILGTFIITILFLSIEIKDEPIFGHIYNVISPATMAAQEATENFFGSSFKKTQRYSKKLFENSVPNGDSVKSKMSGLRKNKGIPEEKILVEEKEQLDDLIKSHR